MLLYDANENSGKTDTGDDSWVSLLNGLLLAVEAVAGCEGGNDNDVVATWIGVGSGVDLFSVCDANSGLEICSDGCCGVFSCIWNCLYSFIYFRWRSIQSLSCFIRITRTAWFLIPAQLY